MQGSGFPREARRRPELDLLVGPLEAATMDGDTAAPDAPDLEYLELLDPADAPTWREDG